MAKETIIGEVIREAKKLPGTVLAFIKSKTAEIKHFVTNLTIEKRDIARAAICLGLIVFFTLLETTFFSVFRPFGVTPELVLSLVIAIGMTEGGGWGGAFGIVAGIITDAMCETGATANVLIFCLIGYFSGLLLEEYFSDMIAVRALMIVGAAVIKVIMTLVTAAAALPDFSFVEVGRLVLLPEFFASALFGVLPHAAAYFSLRWAHKVKTLTGK